MIYTVTLNPALDKTVELEDFKINKVNRTEKVRIDAGGKGINVSRVINNLGGKTCALGILGGDSGRLILKKLTEENIQNRFLFTNTDTRTNLKIVDSKNGTYTDINENGELKDIGVIDRLFNELLGKVTTDDIVVLSGSLPKGADINTYQKWISVFNKKGVKVFFDADKMNLKSGLEAAPYFVKPNLDEFSQLVNKNFMTLIDIRVNAQQLLKKGIKKVAITMGEGGSLFVTEKSAYYASPLNIDVKSTVGAGDSFVAAAALCEQMGKSDADTLKFAAAVSSAKVMCEGTSAPDLELINSLLAKIAVEKI